MYIYIYIYIYHIPQNMYFTGKMMINHWILGCSHSSQKKKHEKSYFWPEMDHEMGKDQEVTRCGDFEGQPRQLDGWSLKQMLGATWGTSIVRKTLFPRPKSSNYFFCRGDLSPSNHKTNLRALRAQHFLHLRNLIAIVSHSTESLSNTLW